MEGTENVAAGAAGGLPGVLDPGRRWSLSMQTTAFRDLGPPRYRIGFQKKTRSAAIGTIQTARNSWIQLA